MGLAELSQKSYLNEDWYNEQTPEWEQLSEAGWVFHRPAFVPCTVGISMTRGRDSATFRVDNEWSRERINTRLLRFCKMFDQESSR